MRFGAEAVALRMVAGLGGSDDFPRDLERAALVSFSISILAIEGLTTAAVEERLGRVLGRAGVGIAPRRLRGCLVALGGHGFVFLDADEEGAVRLALAHEMAHFVGHYLTRRELAVARLGPGILDVLDGRRRPTVEERVAGVIGHCPLGVFSDVMERDGGQPVSALAERMEAEADEAAFLAVAPPRRVLADARCAGRVDARGVTETLVERYGLTWEDARRHAPRVLSTGIRRHGSLLAGLRAARADAAEEWPNGAEVLHG